MINGRLKLTAQLLNNRPVNSQDTKASLEERDVDSSDPFVSTTKEKLLFECGIADHKPIKTTVDSYFNLCRGPGFCKECLALDGITNARDLFNY